MTVDCHESTWITVQELAQLAEIKGQNVRRAISRCAAGGTWRKHALIVKTQHGGPASAQNPHLVQVESLPLELQERHRNRVMAALPEAPQPLLGEALEMPAQIDPQGAKHHQIMVWKATLLTPALQFPKNTPGRVQSLKELAARLHTLPDGRMRTYSYRTLQGWIAACEKEASALPLKPKARARECQPRRVICARWDKACPLPLETMQGVAAELERYVRGLWAKGRGRSKIEELAGSKLLELSQAAGWAEATMKVCKPGRHFVARGEPAKLLAIKDKNAKRWHDHFEPRIKRSREGLRPGDVVVGDVHPVDVLVAMPDGRTITPRFIAWYDVATGDLTGNLVLLDKGKGITQAHAAASFADMVAQWGLPGTRPASALLTS